MVRLLWHHTQQSLDAPTFSDTEAEIGEAVDFVVHVERQPVRRIVREVPALRGLRPWRKTLPERADIRGATCCILRRRMRQILPPTSSPVASLPGDTIALCLRRENPAGILQRKVPLERAIALTAQRMTARRKIA
ncbi:MAG: hypothetical protein WBN92_03405 [Terriglobia bacterium]